MISFQGHGGNRYSTINMMDAVLSVICTGKTPTMSFNAMAILALLPMLRPLKCSKTTFANSTHLTSWQTLFVIVCAVGYHDTKSRIQPGHFLWNPFTGFWPRLITHNQGLVGISFFVVESHYPGKMLLLYTTWNTNLVQCLPLISGCKQQLMLHGTFLSCFGASGATSFTVITALFLRRLNVRNHWRLQRRFSRTLAMILPLWYIGFFIGHLFNKWPIGHDNI